MRYSNKVAGWVLLISLMPIVVQAQRPELPDYISARHRLVLRKWLAREPDLRVATDKDCGPCETDIANQRRERGADYHPYYAVGDFNRDGREDFAVALIELEADREGQVTQKFAVAVFNAPFAGRRSTPPAFFQDNLNLRDGGLFFGPPRPRPYRLFIGLFTNDAGLTLLPRGRKYVAR